MVNNSDKNTGSSPNGSTNMHLTNAWPSAPKANQSDSQNSGAQQHVNDSQNAVLQNARPIINTIYTKKSYNMDAVDVLVGVSSETGQWVGIKYEFWIRQLLEAFVTNNIEDEKEKIFLARSKIDSLNNNTIKAFIDSCKPIAEAQTFGEFRRLLSNVMIKGTSTNYLDAFSNFKKIIWEQNAPIYAFFAKLSEALEEYSMLLYTQTREIVSERIKKSLILSQFAEQCPKKWHSRIVEASNIDLNISDQIKLILDATKHELLINKWNINEEEDQIAHINKGRFDKTKHNQLSTRHVTEGRPISKNKDTIVCYNCFRRGHIKKECRSPAYCQDCREEHKQGSAECRNSWKYGQISREHTKERTNNQVFQRKLGNQSYERGYNHSRNPHRDNHRGRGSYRQNYRPSHEDIQRHESNFNKVAENFERINAMVVPSEENIHDWNVVNDFEEYEGDFTEDNF